MSNPNVDNTCPYCETAMTTTRMCCKSCAVSVETEFPDQPLARLPVEHQRFIEIFVLAGGSLKEIASQAGVSYPTVRSRLDRVIESLRTQLEAAQLEAAQLEAAQLEAAQLEETQLEKTQPKAGKKSTPQSKAADILKRI
ncbi:MAG: hypothetical protein ACI9HK_005356 [Pirellulaceae bacterium]|jgi:hypothetical protein